MTNVYKKPSTLCLPLTCQPDPAIYRRNRKNQEEALAYQPQIYPQQTLERRHSVPIQPLQAGEPNRQGSDPQNAIHVTQSDMDAVLAHYETIFENRTAGFVSDRCESVSTKSSARKAQRKNKFNPNLTPKVLRFEIYSAER